MILENPAFFDVFGAMAFVLYFLLCSVASLFKKETKEMGCDCFVGCWNFRINC